MGVPHAVVIQCEASREGTHVSFQEQSCRVHIALNRSICSSTKRWVPGPMMRPCLWSGFSHIVQMDYSSNYSQGASIATPPCRSIRSLTARTSVSPANTSGVGIILLSIGAAAAPGQWPELGQSPVVSVRLKTAFCEAPRTRLSDVPFVAFA
jgi:hypothetical protein